MKSKIKQLAIIPLAILGFVIGISSCNKKDPAKAEITIVDEDDERVDGATVNIICTAIEKPECKEGIEQEGTTNSSGKVEFEWEHPAIYGSDDVGFAVLKCEARKEFDSTYCHIEVLPSGVDTTICVDSVGVWYGSVFIELQIDKVTKETITILEDD
ncbi:MAG: hypothetical protein JKY42_11505 [Flavobacteriales bacterium]|nr:hypothetical protein [Flavobacteriales bacterium]